MAAWAMGRLLGPQLMVAGGGHPTHQWFGMYYAGQAGRRIPVPLFQATEDFCVYLVLILIERRLNRWSDGSARSGYPPGLVLGTAMILWGIERSLDEHLWLGEDGHLGSLLVQIAGVAAGARRRRGPAPHPPALDCLAAHPWTRRDRRRRRPAGDTGHPGRTDRVDRSWPASRRGGRREVHPPYSVRNGDVGRVAAGPRDLEETALR